MMMFEFPGHGHDVDRHDFNDLVWDGLLDKGKSFVK